MSKKKTEKETVEVKFEARELTPEELFGKPLVRAMEVFMQSYGPTARSTANAFLSHWEIAQMFREVVGEDGAPDQLLTEALLHYGFTFGPVGDSDVYKYYLVKR